MQFSEFCRSAGNVLGKLFNKRGASKPSEAPTLGSEIAGLIANNGYTVVENQPSVIVFTEPYAVTPPTIPPPDVTPAVTQPISNDSVSIDWGNSQLVYSTTSTTYSSNLQASNNYIIQSTSMPANYTFTSYGYQSGSNMSTDLVNRINQLEIQVKQLLELKQLADQKFEEEKYQENRSIELNNE